MKPNTTLMRFWTQWAALGSCVLVSSCSHVNLRGEGLQDNFGSALRPKPEARGETWSLTTKGREIEKNLGH